MAGRGPAPKDPDKRLRRNKEVRSEITAPATPIDRPMPECPYESGWMAQVEEWWLNWCASPMASQFLETDWFRLGTLAPLVQRVCAEQHMESIKELRLQEAQFGATIADRLRLKWDVAKPDAEALKPKQSNARRLRVVDAQAG